MRIIFNLMILLFLSYTGNAQEDYVNIKDPAAKKLLDALSNEVSSYKSVEMDFTLTLSFPGIPPEIQQGKIIQSGNKYFIDLDMQSVYCDGVSLWLHMKNNKEVQWNDAKTAAEGGFMDPSTLLNIYKTEDFSYAIVNEGIKDGKAFTAIEFKPMDSDSPYSKLRMTLNTEAKQLEDITVFAKDASRYTLSVTKLQKNKTYPPATFVFDKTAHPGVHIEDLRM